MGGACGRGRDAAPHRCRQLGQGPRFATPGPARRPAHGRGQCCWHTNLVCSPRCMHEAHELVLPRSCLALGCRGLCARLRLACACSFRGRAHGLLQPHARQLQGLQVHNAFSGRDHTRAPERSLSYSRNEVRGLCTGAGPNTNSFELSLGAVGGPCVCPHRCTAAGLLHSPLLPPSPKVEGPACLRAALAAGCARRAREGGWPWDWCVAGRLVGPPRDSASVRRRPDLFPPPPPLVPPQPARGPQGACRLVCTSG